MNEKDIKALEKSAKEAAKKLKTEINARAAARTSGGITGGGASSVAPVNREGLAPPVNVPALLKNLPKAPPMSKADIKKFNKNVDSLVAAEKAAQKSTPRGGRGIGGGGLNINKTR